MAKKEESPCNIEQEGNHRWFWNAHLNRSPWCTLLSLSNIRNIDQSETFFAIILNLDNWIGCWVKSSILAQVIIMFRRAELAG